MRGIRGEKRLESGLRLWILPRLKGLQRGVVLLTRLIEHRAPGADDCWSARLRGGRRPFAEFERGAGGGLLTRQGRLGLAHERGAQRSCSQRPRRARRVWIDVGVECVRPSWPWTDGRLVGRQERCGDVRIRRWRASGAIAKPEFNILAELLHLRFQPMLGVLQFLDPAVGLPQFFLEPIDAHHKPGAIVGIACRAVWNVGGRRSLAVEDIELSLSRRREHDVSDERGDEARSKRRSHWKCPDCLRSPGPYARLLSILSRGAPRLVRLSQLPAAPLRTVTARRF